MKVRDVMTSPVVSVGPDDSVSEAARIMLRRHISGLPVIDKEGRLVGIVTKAIFCVGPKPERSAGGRAGWNIFLVRVDSRTNTPAPTDARSARS